MNQILTDEEVSAITGIGFEATGRAIEQAILNKLSEQEPVAWNQSGKPLYLHPSPSVPDVFPQAHRLALELECLILDCKDTVVVSRWMESANEALEQWREFRTEYEVLSAARSE